MTAEPASIAATDGAAPDAPTSRFPVAEFRHNMETRQFDKVLENFTEDCLARPLGTDQIEFRGKPKVKALWTAVMGAGQFKYGQQLMSDRTIVILFDISFAGIELEAVDILRINDEGKCYEIFALGRPYTPISLFTGRVALMFAKQGGGFFNRLLTNLLVWPLEIMQRLGEPAGLWILRGAMEKAVSRSGGKG
jgi:hypothetical protein